eukprot:s1076_g14.t1
MVSGAPEKSEVFGAWSMPGLHFQQCAHSKSKPRKSVPFSSLASALQSAQHDQDEAKEPLPNVKCPPGEMPIGHFAGDAYEFNCCNAGQQCGGCRKIRDGICQECAAGFVHQQIPVLNITKCFLCDDIPDWHDSHGRTCYDYESMGFCHGLTFHGLRPSEACCACGGGNVQPTPTSMSFAQQAVVFGDAVDAFPEPQALGTQVDCDLANWNLTIAESGRIHGIAAQSSDTAIKCSLTLMQDPMRGLFATVDLKVPAGLQACSPTERRCWSSSIGAWARSLRPRASRSIEWSSHLFMC